MKNHYFKIFLTILLSTTLLVSCSNDGSSSETDDNPTKVDLENTNQNIDKDSSDTASDINADNVSVNAGAITLEMTKIDTEDYYNEDEATNPTYINLNGTSSLIEGEGARTDSNDIIITAAGSYIIGGDLDDGQIVVNVEDEQTVQLILDNASISCSDSAPIYIQKAEKIIISLPDQTVNTLSDGTNYIIADETSDEPNATIFSKSDLIINGTGTLNIEANYNNGITGKDDLKIIEATLQITSVDDGIVGRDMIAAKESNITIVAGGDGMKSTNDEDPTKGYIVINDCNIAITAGSDGIQAETSMLLTDGVFEITTGGGSENGQNHVENNSWGKLTNTDTSDTTDDNISTSSMKGLKASSDITIIGGTLTINSSDDAIHSNNSIVINSGIITLASGDDGIHSDTIINILDGTISITESYEGIESTQIIISDGDINIVSSDDGINVNGGNDGSSMNGRPGENSFQSTGDNYLTINGGYIDVNANGDGLDSNGSIYMTGGTVLVNGPTNDGNGALDYQGSFEITGGYLIASGSSGMAQAPSDQSSQYSLGILFTQTQQADTIVHLEDSTGASIITFAPSKNFTSAVISTPEIKSGETYTLSTGGSSTSNNDNGLYTDEDYTGGNKLVEFTISDIITWVNESGITTNNGEFNRGGFSRPDGDNVNLEDFKRPDGEDFNPEDFNNPNGEDFPQGGGRRQ